MCEDHNEAEVDQLISEEIALEHGLANVQNPENVLIEAKQAEVNQWGCICRDEDEGCDQCTEYETVYPHVDELRDESISKFVGPALQNYNSSQFHGFINRKCR